MEARSQLFGRCERCTICVIPPCFLPFLVRSQLYVTIIDVPLQGFMDSSFLLCFKRARLNSLAMTSDSEQMP